MSLPLLTNARGRHRLTKSRVYKIWGGMKSRCYTPSATGYENYGGKGIAVCAEWHSFETFFADMGHPAPGMSIERINNSKNYSAENCKWATKTEQNRNQCDLVYITRSGVTKCLTEWAADAGTSYSTIKARLNNGWDIDRALTTPVRGHKVYERRAS